MILHWFICIIASSNSTKPTGLSVDKDLSSAGGNTVIGDGAAAVSCTASPSHSLSPENVIIESNINNCYYNYLI